MKVTGEIIDGQEPVSLVRFKLYPYVLFGCAVLGMSSDFTISSLQKLFINLKMKPLGPLG